MQDPHHSWRTPSNPVAQVVPTAWPLPRSWCLLEMVFGGEGGWCNPQHQHHPIPAERTSIWWLLLRPLMAPLTCHPTRKKRNRLIPPPQYSKSHLYKNRVQIKFFLDWKKKRARADLIWSKPAVKNFGLLGDYVLLLWSEEIGVVQFTNSSPVLLLYHVEVPNCCAPLRIHFFYTTENWIALFHCRCLKLTSHLRLFFIR